MKMKMAEIRSQAAEEIQRLLKENKQALRHLKAKAGAQDLKDVRSIRNKRQLIARFSTRLSELKANKS